MPEATHVLCAVCSRHVEPETAHSLHEAGCGKPHGTSSPDQLCDCDAVAHPDCCPALGCQDIGTGFAVEVLAQYAVPPWFTEKQAEALAAALVHYLTQPAMPLHSDHGPRPSAWYGYDTAYICAATAGTRVLDRTTVDRPAVIWGHGNRCKACHHLETAHPIYDAERCAEDGCTCSKSVRYARPSDIGNPPATTKPDDLQTDHARIVWFLGTIAKSVRRQPNGTWQLNLSDRQVKALNAYNPDFATTNDAGPG